MLASPGFDFASPSVPANVTYTGAILDEPTWAEPWTDERSDGGDPLVLVGFSTTYQEQGPLLQRVVDALSSLPVDGIVTLGQMLAPDAVLGLTQRHRRAVGAARPDPRPRRGRRSRTAATARS